LNCLSSHKVRSTHAVSNANDRHDHDDDDDADDDDVELEHPAIEVSDDSASKALARMNTNGLSELLFKYFFHRRSLFFVSVEIPNKKPEIR